MVDGLTTAEIEELAYDVARLVQAGWVREGSDTWSHPEGKTTMKTRWRHDGCYEEEYEDPFWKLEEALEELNESQTR